MIRTTGIALAGLLLAGAAAVSYAQDTDPKTELEQRFEKKVAESWFTDNGFTADYDVARERAKEGGKPIFAYFTRSFQP